MEINTATDLPERPPLPAVAPDVGAVELPVGGSRCWHASPIWPRRGIGWRASWWPRWPPPRRRIWPRLPIETYDDLDPPGN